MCIEGDSFGTKSEVLMEKPLSGRKWVMMLKREMMMSPLGTGW